LLIGWQRIVAELHLTAKRIFNICAVGHATKSRAKPLHFIQLYIGFFHNFMLWGEQLISWSLSMVGIVPKNLNY